MTDYANPATPDDLFFDALVKCYVDGDYFVRRDWLALEVNNKLQDPECRFVLLTSEPLGGKSTFMAQLAYDHPEWPRYFIQNLQHGALSGAGTRSFLMRIGLQLSERFPDLFARDDVVLDVEQEIGTLSRQGSAVGVDIKTLIASPFYRRVMVKVKQKVQQAEGSLQGIRIETVIAEPRLLPLDDLQNLALFEPARKLTQPIVILIDALDYLRYHDWQDNLLDWLTRCPIGDLPANVRFVLTSRPPDSSLELFCGTQKPYVKMISLTADDLEAETQAHLREDSRLFAKKIISKDANALKPYWTTANTTPEGFEDEAVNKAAGNLGYLDAIARALAQALKQEDKNAIQGLLSLRNIPNNLKELYILFLSSVRNQVKDDRVRVINPDTGQETYPYAWEEIYLPVMEVLSVALAPLTQQQIHDLATLNVSLSIMSNHLDRLLNFLDQVGDGYRFYHPSLADLLTDPNTAATAPQFFCDAKRCHERVVNSYLKQTENWLQCDLYGLNYLPKHLISAGEHAQAGALLTNIDFIEAKTSKVGLEELLQDLRRAMSLAPPESCGVIHDLLSLLYREGHKIVRWTQEETGRDFAQQITYGAQRWKMERFREPAIQRLHQGRPHWWSLQWIGDVQSQALERTVMAKHLGKAFGIESREYLALQQTDSVQIWDLQTWNLIQTIRASGEYCVPSPDGLHLIVGDRNRLDTWDLNTFKPELSIVAGNIQSVQFTPDSAHFIVMGDSTIEIWDVAAKSRKQLISGDLTEARKITITPNSKYLLCEKGDRLQIVNMETGKVMQWPGETGSKITRLSVSPDGAHLVVGYLDKQIAVFRVETGNVVSRFSQHQEIVTDVGFVPQSTLVITGSQGAEIRVWDLLDGAEKYAFAAHNQPIKRIAFSPQGTCFISLGGTLPKWGTMGGRPVEIIASSYRDLPSEIMLWSISEATIKPVSRLIGQRSEAMACTFTNDGQRLVVGFLNGELLAWDLNEREAAEPVSGKTFSSYFSKRAWSDRLKRMLVRSPKGALLVTRRPPAGIFGGHEGGVEWAHVFKRDRCLLSKGSDDAVKAWSMDAARCRFETSGHRDEIVALAVVPGSREVLTASKDTSLKLWDRDTGSVLHTFVGHGREITKLAVTTDGQFALTSSKDEQVIVWNISKRQQERTFGLHAAIVSDVALPDDRHAVSLSLDGIIYVWNILTGRVVREIALPEPAGGAFGQISTLWMDPDGKGAIGYAPKAVSIMNRMLGVVINENYDGSFVIDFDGGKIKGRLPYLDGILMTREQRYCILYIRNHLKGFDDTRGKDGFKPLSGSPHEKDICAIAASPYSKWVVSGSEDTTIRVWNLEGMTLERILTGHTEAVNLLQVTEDGRYLVSTGSDRTLRAWDTQTWEQAAVVTVDSIPTCLQLIQERQEGSLSDLTAIVGDRSGSVYCFQKVISNNARRSEKPMEPGGFVQ
jgi:WD40 repeat protein